MAFDFGGLEGQIQAASTGRPFGVCRTCGLQQVIPGKVACPECERLAAMKFGAPPADAGAGVKDTQLPQSYPNNDHSGYKDTIPTKKFPSGKERV